MNVFGSLPLVLMVKPVIYVRFVFSVISAEFKIPPHKFRNCNSPVIIYSVPYNFNAG